MKKLMALFATLGLTVGLAAACNTGENTQSTPSSPNSNVTSSEVTSENSSVGEVVVTATEIEADFYKGDAIIYESASIESLKQYVTLTVYYSDDSEQVVEDYTITGTMAAGTQTFTVAYEGFEDTFSTKIEAVEVTEITATVAEGYTLGLNSTTDDVKAFLTVTANKNDGSSETITDFTVSGEIKGGACDFTVAYSTYTATVTLNVTVAAEAVDETGSTTNLVAVGDKFIENFAEVNAGAKFDASWGTDLVWSRKATKDSIDGYGMFISYAGAGDNHGDRSAMIIEGITLTGGYTYKLSYDVKPLAGTVTEIGTEVQNAGIWQSVAIEGTVNNVYSVSHQVTLPSTLNDGVRFLIYAPRKDAQAVSYVIDNLVLELVSIPVVETFSEEGSTTRLSAVGDKFIENFGEIPSGIAFDVSWGNNQSYGVVSGENAIDGNSFVVSYSGEGRSAIIVNGLKLQASTGYKVSFKYKALSQHAPHEIGVEVQYGNIWTSKAISTLTADNGVYDIELTFTTAADLNTNDARILIYCPRANGEEVAEVKYAIDNFVVEVTSAPQAETTVINPIDETGSTKVLTSVGTYYRENFTDGTDGAFDGAYNSTTGWGYTEENSISGRSYYINYSDSANRGCMIVYGITLKQGYTYQFSCLMSYTAGATAAVVDIEVAGGVHSQYISHLQEKNGVYSVVINFVAGQDVTDGRLLFMISNFQGGGAVKMLVDNLQIKCVEVPETGSTKDLTTVGAYYRENFTDGTDGAFDGYYNSTTGWGYTEEESIYGKSYYLNYSDSANRGCMLIYGLSLKAGNTYKFACQMKYTANADAAVVDIEIPGTGVRSQYISHLTNVDGVYNVVIEFTAGQDVNGGTLLFMISNFQGGGAVNMVVDNLEISCVTAA